MTTNLKVFNSIRTYLKAGIAPWKEEIRKRQNGRCRISNQWRSVDVHHVSKSFSQIMEETFEVIGIEYRPYTHEYTPEELALLISTCLELHKDVQGVLVARRLHELYHKQFKRECTTENWREFKSQFKARRRVA